VLILTRMLINPSHAVLHRLVNPRQSASHHCLFIVTAAGCAAGLRALLGHDTIADLAKPDIAIDCYGLEKHKG
jgi:hypothetical protein